MSNWSLHLGRGKDGAWGGGGGGQGAWSNHVMFGNVHMEMQSFFVATLQSFCLE